MFRPNINLQITELVTLPSCVAAVPSDLKTLKDETTVLNNECSHFIMGLSFLSLPAGQLHVPFSEIPLIYQICL